MIIDTISIDEIYGQKEEVEQAKSNGWVVIFNDLLSLLLTFFILFFSISAENQEKWQEIVSATSHANTNINQFDQVRGRSLDIDYLESIFKRKINNAKLQDLITMRNTNNILYLAIVLDKAFEKDSVVFKDDFLKVFGMISNSLYDIDNEVNVNLVSNHNFINSNYIPERLSMQLNRTYKVLDLLRNEAHTKDMKMFMLNKEHYIPNLDVLGDVLRSSRMEIIVFDYKSNKNKLYNEK